MSGFPKNKYTLKRGSGSRGLCEKCEKECNVRGLIKLKGKYLCYSCRQKRQSSRIMNSSSNHITQQNIIPLETVLERVHTVKTYLNKEGKYGHCAVSFPLCMHGKKFKITLVEDEPNTESYEEWLILNKDECIRTFAKDCDLQVDEVEDWYGAELDKYCREWYKELVEDDKYIRGVK